MPPQERPALPPIGAVVPQSLQTPEEQTYEAVRGIGRFTSGMWENLNPVTMATGVARYLYDPQGVIGDAATNMAIGIGQAIPEAEAGQYGRAAMTAASGFPIVGPPAQKVQEGNYLGATGNLAGLLLPFGIARMSPRSVGVRNPNANVARAMDTALDAGVPLGTATVSGSTALNRIQFGLDAGTVAGLKNWEAPVAKGFQKMGTELAEQVRPGPTTSGELAGQGVIAAFDRLIKRFKTAANVAYTDLRAMARDPQNIRTVQVGMEQAVDAQGKPVFDPNGSPRMVPVMKDIEAPVDMRAAKAELTHRYEVLKDTITEGKRVNDPGFTAIKNIVGGPDYVPLEVALENYSALGGRSVGTEAAGLRSAGEGLSAHSFGKLKAAIDDTLSTMGMAAQKAFVEGRFAHRHMKNTAETLDAIAPIKEGVGREPVQAFERLVRPNDANISMLRRVNAAAPQELQNLGRAAFEEHLTRITAHGGLEHTKAALNWWDRLGPKTKDMLWPDPRVQQRVGDFFLAMKTWADSPNPSGTGAINQMMAVIRNIGPVASGAGTAMAGPASIPYQIGASAIDVALHSPRIAKVMTRGGAPIRTPLNIAAGANVAGQAAEQAPPPMASHEKVVTQAQLEAVAQMNGTDVATEAARAKAEGYVIR